MIIISKNIDNRQSCEANARRKARKEEGSIENRIKHEAEGRRLARRQVDVATGLSRLPENVAQRGDFKLCRDANKILKDYRNHKDPQARKEIVNHYFQLQRESRRS